VDHRDSGSPWTGGHCRSRELARARPPSAPVPESSDQGAGEREGGPANSMAGLPRLGRRWKGGSPATETSAQKDDGEGTVRARRGGIGGVGGFTVEAARGRPAAVPCALGFGAGGRRKVASGLGQPEGRGPVERGGKIGR
jgi:hypothetical protein